jgi:hypothetical protein
LLITNYGKTLKKDKIDKLKSNDLLFYVLKKKRLIHLKKKILLLKSFNLQPTILAVTNIVGVGHKNYLKLISRKTNVKKVSPKNLCKKKIGLLGLKLLSLQLENKFFWIFGNLLKIEFSNVLTVKGMTFS